MSKAITLLQTEILEDTLHKWLFIFWNFWISLKLGSMSIFPSKTQMNTPPPPHAPDTHFHINLRDIFSSLFNLASIGYYKTMTIVVFQVKKK